MCHHVANRPRVQCLAQAVGVCSPRDVLPDAPDVRRKQSSVYVRVLAEGMSAHTPIATYWRVRLRLAESLIFTTVLQN
jgi:hypothetical protein